MLQALLMIIELITYLYFNCSQKHQYGDWNISASSLLFFVTVILSQCLVTVLTVIPETSGILKNQKIASHTAKVLGWDLTCCLFRELSVHRWTSFTPMKMKGFELIGGKGAFCIQFWNVFLKLYTFSSWVELQHLAIRKVTSRFPL